MKSKLLCGLFAGTVALSASAQQQPELFYNIQQGVSLLAPPTIPPNVDAINFVNHGQFVINFTNQLPFDPPPQNPYPFETQNTLNYSNFFGATMSCNTGFRLETFVPPGGPRRPANSFFNDGVVECGTLDTSNFFFFSFGSGGGFFFNFGSISGAKLLVSATNILSPGEIDMGFDSVCKLKGDSINLERGAINMENFGFGVNNGGLFFNGGIFDGYWGLGRNTGSPEPPPMQPIFPDAQFGSSPAFTPSHLVTNRDYSISFPVLGGTNFLTYLRDELDNTGTNRFVRAVFLGNTNLNINANVFFPTLFFGGFGGFADIEVEFSSIFTNTANGAVTTNFLYVFDSFGSRTNFSLVLNGFAGSRPTFIPFNYNIFQSSTPFFAGTPPEVPTLIPPGTFPNLPTTNQYSAYEALFQPLSTVLGDTFGQDVTNVPGRIEISASKFLNLDQARISSLNYLLLSATNQFGGSAGAQISSAFADIFLRTTNGLLAITNLLAPDLNRPEGTLELYSARWTNVIGGITNHFHVLFVDAKFSPTSPTRVQDIILRSTNSMGGPDSLLISDTLDITRSFLFDSTRLTITTNDPGAASLTGGITLEDPGIVWSTSTPRLQYLTNFGFINTLNATFFGGSRTSPYYTTTFDEPYVEFINAGGITNFSAQIWASDFQNTGTFFATGGAILLQENQTARLINGAFIALGGEISIGSGSLLVSNHMLLAGGALTLDVTNLLDDGSLYYSVDVVSNKNIWLAGNGFNLLTLPAKGSLLATTVTNTNPAFRHQINTWAGADYGCSPEGFTRKSQNAALGRLVLDGITNSLFEFRGSDSGPHALYVDNLEFRDYTTNTDNAGNWIGISNAPNMKIYYAQAVSAGLDVSEKLNGKNNGSFCWVSDFNCGFFSSTNIIYPDLTTNRVNTALAQACDIDSNTNGIPNCNDPAPISNPGTCPLPEPPPDPSTNNTPPPGSGGSTNSTPATAGVPTLDVPASASSSAPLPNGFALAKGAYNGLFSDTNGVTAFSSGYFTATTTERRTFSAKLTIGSHTYSISGLFNSQGHVTRSIVLKDSSILTVYLELDLSGGEQIRGRITHNGVWSADLLAYLKSGNSAALAGNYTMRIPADAISSNGPGGIGYGTAKVDARGTVQWSGVLADGVKASQKTGVSKQGIWPLYASLYGGGGSILSWMQFANESASDVSGQLLWLKASGLALKSYPRGFTNEVEAIGSLYTRAAASPRVLDVVFSGGGLHEPFTNSVSLGLNNKSAAPNAGKLTLSIAPASGLFKGSALDPASGKALQFQGVLLQKLNIGAGFFLNTDQSGQINLSPAP